MNLLINGEAKLFDDIATLAELLRALGFEPERPGTAIALNERVISRRDLVSTPLAEGDRVEIIQAVQGG